MERACPQALAEYHPSLSKLRRSAMTQFKYFVGIDIASATFVVASGPHHGKWLLSLKSLIIMRMATHLF